MLAPGQDIRAHVVKARGADVQRLSLAVQENVKGDGREREVLASKGGVNEP